MEWSGRIARYVRLIQADCVIWPEIMQFRDYLEAHGYDTTQMGLRDREDSVASIEETADEKVNEKEVVV